MTYLWSDFLFQQPPPQSISSTADLQGGAAVVGSGSGNGNGSAGDGGGGDGDGAPGGHSPKCRSHSTRATAFKLIAALCDGGFGGGGGGGVGGSGSGGDGSVGGGVLALLTSGLSPLRDKVRNSTTTTATTAIATSAGDREGDAETTSDAGASVVGRRRGRSSPRWGYDPVLAGRNPVTGLVGIHNPGECGVY